MCDYSLEARESRDAVAGDKLVIGCFTNTTTRGFCAVGEPEVAVCLKPGTELVFEKPVAFSGLFRFLLQAYQHECLTARFRYVNIDNHLVHHDALEFDNGQIVLVTHLKAGQYATVLQLPVVAGKKPVVATEAPRVLVSAD